MKIGCPHMGEYTTLIQDLCDYLGWELILPPRPSDRTIQLGTRYMQELMCLPAKVTLGSFIEACDLGAKHVFMFDSCGECRLKTYWILQQHALKKLGYDVTVHPITLGWRTPGDIQRIDRSVMPWRAWGAFFRLLRQVVRLDRELWYEIPEESRLPRIGIVGEIFSILSPETNKDIIKKLERMGALVHNSLPLSYFLFKGLYIKGLMKQRNIDREVWLRARKLAHEYFPKEIGGHGNESIVNTLYYAMKGFDGVIHVVPFPCMPESTVAPIIDDIGQNYEMPIMRLIFDTHTAEGGLDTRLEAFVDILTRKKGRNGENK